MLCCRTNQQNVNTELGVKVWTRRAEKNLTTIDWSCVYLERRRPAIGGLWFITRLCVMLLCYNSIVCFIIVDTVKIQ